MSGIKTEIAVFGGGCFWCTEAIFKALKGIISVMPGYAGGILDKPTYEQVCAGKSGHAEVVKIEFDPAVITYADLLKVFFATHDPTTMNKQGNDIGTQYRSVVFTTSDNQTVEAKKMIEKLNNLRSFDGSVVTRIEPLTNFFAAEDYHSDYYTKNPAASYCQIVISPKLAKIRTSYKHLLK